jgi:alpha-L-arabinofuranosidase
MKNIFSALLLLLYMACPAYAAYGHEPDSVYLFSYATGKNNHHNGLHFAWSRDREQWHLIGNEWGFLKSDYGRWGAEKRMLSPYLIQGTDGLWHCVWSLNEREPAFAHAASADLVHWRRQSYPVVAKSGNVSAPIVLYDNRHQHYSILFTNTAKQYYRTTTKNFSSYTPVEEVPASAYTTHSVTVDLPGGRAGGQIHRVAWAVADQLIKAYGIAQYKMVQEQETSAQDSLRFAGISKAAVTITVHPEKARPISDLLLGIFFEDINYAADGGLYAELVQNRDFEYAPGDKEGRDPQWNSMHSWKLTGDNTTIHIDTIAPIHVNNPHYAMLDTKAAGAVLSNTGFDGIPVRKGEKYQLSLFCKRPDNKGGKLRVTLVSKQQEVLAQTILNIQPGEWKSVQATLTATASSDEGHLELQPLNNGRLQLDMVSLFPAATFKNRKNGLRKDLAETIAGIRPRFVRFPGGCVAHGDGLANMYRWKNTIGALEARKPQRNIWGYHQSAGLGYFEYFQFCEDIGATPLPVVAAGVPCQNSATGGGGQQGGIPMDEMDDYVQEVLDLVEYANGDVHTEWGKKRAQAGHPAPFNLRYLGVGNEDLITDVFEERFTMIYQALKEKHPEITVIGTAGPFNEGTDYEEGWDLATRLKVPMLDEHYYQTAGWFINNQDFYDKYDRSHAKVYLGEYAARLPGAKVNLETALAEAVYLTGLERNGDIVSMASYAPLLAKEGHTQWNPDMIYFNNTSIQPATAYYVQQMFGNNAGDEYLPGNVSLSVANEALRKRIAVSVVRDTKSRDVILKLVNVSSVPVASSIDLGAVVLADNKAARTVLAGRPDAKNATPVTTADTVAQKFETELPPYSFTILRIKTK